MNNQNSNAFKQTVWDYLTASTYDFESDCEKETAQHMKPQIELGNVWTIETESGETFIVPECVQSYDGETAYTEDGETIKTDFEDTFKAYTDGEKIETADCEHGWHWRLSAPGYTDSTDWSGAFLSVYHAVDDMLQMFDELDLCDVLESETDIDTDALIEGYFVALAFTGSRTTPDDSVNPKFTPSNYGPKAEYTEQPLVEHAGGCITNVIDADDVKEWLTDEQTQELTEELLGFALSAGMAMSDHVGNGIGDWIEEIDWNDLGSDFHLTRNGHGAGFWDGDWKLQIDDQTEIDFGDVLTELSKPFGTCELDCYGFHIDDDELQDKWEGTDADLETSLFEYGLIWSTEADNDGQIRFRYPVGYDNDDDKETPTHFSWGCLDKMTTEDEFKSEFGWVNWGDLFSYIDCASFADWIENNDFGQCIADLVSYYGTQNIFGEDYTEGQRIHTSDHMVCDIRN